MAKLLVLLCIALFAMTLVMACKPPGWVCATNEDCCSSFICNPWAGRCTKGPIGPRYTGGDEGLAYPAAQ